MAGTVRELVTKWGFDIDHKPLQEMGKNIFLLKESLQAVFEVGRKVWESTFGLADSAGEHGKEIAEMAQAYGITVERMQEYNRLAARSGLESQRFGMGLSSLGEAAQKALFDPKGEQAWLFKLMDIKPEDLKDKFTGGVADMDTLMHVAADGLGRIKNDTERLNRANELFGRRLGRDFLIMLSGGSNALDKNLAQIRGMGVVFDANAIKKQEKFKNLVIDTQAELQHVKDQVGTALIPTMTDLINQFSKFVMSKEGQKFITKDLPEALREIAALMKEIVSLVPKITAAANALAYLRGERPMGGIPKSADPLAANPGKFGVPSFISEHHVRAARGGEAWARAHAESVERFQERAILQNLNQHNVINIHGATDPNATATAVGQKVGAHTKAILKDAMQEVKRDGH